AYESGDPYLTFAKQTGRVPADATASSHRAERDRFKTTCLALQYGIGPESLARRLYIGAAEGRDLIRMHKEVYARNWRWSDAAEMTAMLNGQISTVFGWVLHVGPEVNPRSIRNFPLQANCGEILRIACVLATESGIQVCCPVHDALLIEASS